MENIQMGCRFKKAQPLEPCHYAGHKFMLDVLLFDLFVYFIFSHPGIVNDRIRPFIAHWDFSFL
ncbi:MAG: hypothetical protein SV375_21795, partial [Thermodesulfobacteriota bacterium]|nr:hypothetical protein [Thermodesulfobacteriota bacterium]